MYSSDLVDDGFDYAEKMRDENRKIHGVSPWRGLTKGRDESASCTTGRWPGILVGAQFNRVRTVALDDWVRAEYVRLRRPLYLA